MATEPEVFSITEAQTGMADDQRGRHQRYTIGMSVRTLCFIGAMFTSGALRWIMVVGAVALPYFAVIIANAGRERGAWGGNKPFTPQKRDAITTGTNSIH
jgi:hypothetical protein